jgi:peptidoglycan/LPS O-acetylase OafA/YrhL
MIWVAGAIAAWCSRCQGLAPFLTSLGTRVGAVALLAVALLLSKVGLGDLGLGMAVALALPAIAHLPIPGGVFRSLARASSEISYTLYLTHFPLLTLIVMVGFTPAKYAPSVTAAVIYSALIFAAIIWAIAVWWCFERNTDRLFFLVYKHATRSESPAPA